MSEIWTSINFEYLEKGYNFSKNHLLQLYQSNKVEPDTVQLSIAHLTYDLEHSHFDHDKCKSTPINMLMGMLRKGSPYLSSYYKSPQLLAQERLNEQRKKEQEQLEQLTQEAQKMAYQDWRTELSPSDREHLKSPNGKLLGISSEHDLKHFFRLHIWPKKKAHYVTES